MRRFFIVGALAALLLGVALGFTPATPAYAAPQTFTPTTTTDELDGSCEMENITTFETNGDGLSLREAICLANQTPDADTINLTGSGYDIDLLGDNENANATGDFDITQPLTINGSLGEFTTELDADNSDRVFHVLSGSLTLNDLIIEDGDVTGNGGNILAESGVTALTITGSTLNRGASTRGGSIYSLADSTTIIETTIQGSTAELFGGGISADNTVLIERSLIEGNTATSADGGGVTNDGAATVTIRDTTIAGNTTLTGGGINVFGEATYNLEQVTLVDNTATGGSGLYVDFDGILNASSTLVAGNTPAASQCADDGGTINLNATSLVQAGSGCPTGGTTVESSQTLAQLLDTQLSDNGGPTETYALVPGSDAIDAGTCGTAPDRDQRGIIRTVVDSSCDIGAFELYTAEATYTVDSTAASGDADPGDLVCDDGSGACTLQAAYEQAIIALQKDTIILQPGETYLPDMGTFEFIGDVVIVGNGATIDASANPSEDMLSFDLGTVFVDGLAVTNVARYAVDLDEAGGTFVNLLLYGNGSGLLAGEQVTTVLVNSTITGNDLGLFKNHSSSPLEVYNSIIWGNTMEFSLTSEAEATFEHSNVGVAIPMVSDGGNNTNVDPEFADAANDDYALSGTSPLRDAGSNALLPADEADRDGDSDTSEPTPLDLPGLLRVQNTTVDVGAYEFVTMPDRPSGLTAAYDAGLHQVGLSWTAASTNESGFILERQKDGASGWVTLTTLPADTESYTDETVTCDQDYVYRVIATNTAGASAPAVSSVVNTACDIFADVPGGLPAPFMEAWVEDFFQAGITTGKAVCDDGSAPGPGETFYCGSDSVTRADMAVFIIRAVEYPDLPHTPMDNPDDPFADVPGDLPAPFMEPWVEEFLGLGITTGKGQCDDGSTPGPGETLYCPRDPVTRADMAVFILRALGTTVTDNPDDPFADVPSNLPAPFMEAFVETFLREGITTGKAVCDDGSAPGPGEAFYCPRDEVTRGDMAVFILRAFGLIPDPNDP